MTIRKKMFVPLLITALFGLGATTSHAALSGAQLVKKCKVSFSANEDLNLKEGLNVALDSGACSGFIGVGWPGKRPAARRHSLDFGYGAGCAGLELIAKR